MDTVAEKEGPPDLSNTVCISEDATMHSTDTFVIEDASNEEVALTGIPVPLSRFCLQAPCN
jgi:hypothetical protein